MQIEHVTNTEEIVIGTNYSKTENIDMKSQKNKNTMEKRTKKVKMRVVG